MVTAAASRGPALAACEFLIDWLKTKAPFWKLEETAEGEQWVDAREADGAAAKRWGAYAGSLHVAIVTGSVAPAPLSPANSNFARSIAGEPRRPKRHAIGAGIPGDSNPEYGHEHLRANRNFRLSWSPNGDYG